MAKRETFPPVSLRSAEKPALLLNRNEMLQIYNAAHADLPPLTEINFDVQDWIKTTALANKWFEVTFFGENQCLLNSGLTPANVQRKKELKAFMKQTIFVNQERHANKIGIFLDDVRFPKDVTWEKLPLKGVDWYICRSVEAVRILVEECLETFPTYFSFDHDLQDSKENKEINGCDCVKWLINHCRTNNLFMPVCYFHSANEVGKKNMLALHDDFVQEQKQLHLL